MHIRQTKLLDIVNHKQKVSVTDLAEALDVSEVTIRKDLTALEQKGLLHREHGYAVMSASNEALHQLSFNYERKRRIAVRAAESVKNGETVMLTSGACCTLLAEELAIQKNDVTIITNSAFLAAFIRKYPKTHVILLGGDYQNDAQVLVGPLVRACASQFSADKIFVSPDGFGEQGSMSANLMRAESSRAMAENANKIILLAETATLDRKSLVQEFPLDKIDCIYTDERPHCSTLKQLEQHGVQIEMVPSASPRAHKES